MNHAMAKKPVSKREQNRVEKRANALDAALAIFSSKGYAATTMDAIAAEAGLTKPTLYQYFSSKDELFREMMLAPRDQMLMAFDHSVKKCHVEQLWEFSWAYARTVMHPEFLALARLTIGDAQRNPDMGKAYQASGPDRVLAGLSEFMANQAKLKRLQIEDAELAAEDFWGLILSAPRNRALHIPDSDTSVAELGKYIKNGIKVFLSAYSTSAGEDLKRLSALIRKHDKKNAKK